MLLHIRQVLTPEQRAKLTSLYEQWQREQPRQATSQPERSEAARDRDTATWIDSAEMNSQ